MRVSGRDPSPFKYQHTHDLDHCYIVTVSAMLYKEGSICSQKARIYSVHEMPFFMGRHPRIRREDRTIRAMIKIYCHARHDADKRLCASCQDLQNYATTRLDKCPFQENKTTCANCTVHCYKPSMRDKIKEVMRYSGPRMTYRHPFLALSHFFDGMRKSRLKS